VTKYEDASVKSLTKKLDALSIKGGGGGGQDGIDGGGFSKVVK